MYVCRAMILLASWRHGRMAPVVGVWEWKNRGSLGKTGRGDKERVSPSMSMTSWSTWSSAWGWMRSQLRAERVRIKGKAGTDVIVEGCYRPPNQEDQANEASYRHIGEASCPQALVLMGEFNHPNICWRDNTAGHKQSRRFLQCI